MSKGQGLVATLFHAKVCDAQEAADYIGREDPTAQLLKSSSESLEEYFERAAHYFTLHGVDEKYHVHHYLAGLSACESEQVTLAMHPKSANTITWKELEVAVRNLTFDDISKSRLAFAKLARRPHQSIEDFALEIDTLVGHCAYNKIPGDEVAKQIKLLSCLSESHVLETLSTKLTFASFSELVAAAVSTQGKQEHPQGEEGDSQICYMKWSSETEAVARPPTPELSLVCPNMVPTSTLDIYEPVASKKRFSKRRKMHSKQKQNLVEKVPFSGLEQSPPVPSVSLPQDYQGQRITQGASTSDIKPKKAKRPRCPESSKRISLANRRSGNPHNSNVYICAHCNYETHRKSNLRRHMTCWHDPEKPTKVKSPTHEYKCPLCMTFSSASREVMFSHYKSIHDIQISSPDSLSFNDWNLFMAWKSSTEKQEVSEYVVYRRTVKPKFTLCYFRCHRDGHYKCRGNGIRRLKIKGSNKIGCCPASINVKIFEDGRVHASFISTHVGHQPEIDRLRLPKDDRDTLAQKIAQNVPLEAILEDVRSSVFSDGIRKVHLINRKDLKNIIRDKNLKDKSLSVTEGSDASW